jgi:NADH-quinone oxidoreductase subunit G
MPDSLDMPMGFKTGAGVIFGATGGVTEAVLRYAAEALTHVKNENAEFVDVRGMDGVRQRTLTLGDVTLKIAIVHGLKNARTLVEAIRKGEAEFDFVEVMACPGGCISGAGQPVAFDAKTRAARAEGLYNADKTLQLHTAQDNPYLQKCYQETLGEIGGKIAHELLHTQYHNRKRFDDAGFSVSENGAAKKLPVNVCVGTSCYVRGSQKLLEQTLGFVKDNGLDDSVAVRATFCFEQCDRGPTVRIGDTVLNKCTFEQVRSELKKQIATVMTAI